MEENNDVMRTTYVKSSSFPLVPQLTKGQEIDKFRIQMERYEEKIGMPVRASYQTANKVGANKNAITLFNPNGTINDGNISLMNMDKGSLTLDRDNFRIQQDVPYKSNKKKKDTVSIGTQTLKLLFGNGVLALDGFKLDGKSYTGQQLYDKFNNDFNNYILNKKKQLYNYAGVNEETGEAIDKKKTLQKLQELLKREAE